MTVNINHYSILPSIGEPNHLRKFWVCHAPKPDLTNLRNDISRHGHRGLTNWLKWYSTDSSLHDVKLIRTSWATLRRRVAEVQSWTSVRTSNCWTEPWVRVQFKFSSGRPQKVQFEVRWRGWIPWTCSNLVRTSKRWDILQPICMLDSLIQPYHIADSIE